MHFIPLIIAIGLLVLAIAYWQVTLVVGLIGVIVYHLVQDSKKQKERLAKIEAAELEAKRESDARGGLPLADFPLDLVLMDQDYERLYRTAKHVDRNYIAQIVIPVLAGKQISRDEFQRLEFEQQRQKNIDEIKVALLHFEVSVYTFWLEEYDFEAKCFPVTMNISTHVPNSYGEVKLIFPNWMQNERGGLKARLVVNDNEAAKRLRQSGVSAHTALLIFKPVVARAHGHYQQDGFLVSELLGVRLLAGKPPVPLLKTIRA